MRDSNVVTVSDDLCANQKIWACRLDNGARKVYASNQWVDTRNATFFACGQTVFVIDAGILNCNQHVAFTQVVYVHIGDLLCPYVVDFADSKCSGGRWGAHVGCLSLCVKKLSAE